MTLDEYLEKLLNTQKQLPKIDLTDYKERFKIIFKWVLSDGINLIGNEVGKYSSPLWNVNHTKENQFDDVRKAKGEQRKYEALAALKRHFDQDLDLLTEQVKGLLKTLSD